MCCMAKLLFPLLIVNIKNNMFLHASFMLVRCLLEACEIIPRARHTALTAMQRLEIMSGHLIGSEISVIASIGWLYHDNMLQSTMLINFTIDVKNMKYAYVYIIWYSSCVTTLWMHSAHASQFRSISLQKKYKTTFWGHSLTYGGSVMGHLIPFK